MFLDALANGRQAPGKGEHVMVFRALAHFAEARVIAVLLAAAGIATRCLNVPVACRANPHLSPCRGHRQALDAFQGAGIGDFAAPCGFVPKTLARALAEYACTLVADVSQPAYSAASFTSTMASLAESSSIGGS